MVNMQEQSKKKHLNVGRLVYSIPIFSVKILYIRTHNAAHFFSYSIPYLNHSCDAGGCVV
jgi:hypothetical protein